MAGAGNEDGTGDRGPHVVVVGGGFAGVGCAKALAKHGVRVTLIDRNNSHQFQPLLYQVATAELALIDVARPFRGIFHADRSVTIKHGEVTAVDLDACAATVVTAAGATEVVTGDHLVLAAGSVPNFFGVPGAEEHAFALYDALQANYLRTRLFASFEDAAGDPRLIDKGALTVVIVGGGPTGVETAGAVADLVNDVMPKRYRDLDASRARVILVDHGPAVLSAFSDKAHTYAATRLTELGVELRLNTGVTEITNDRVKLSDGAEILTHTVVWAGGIRPPALVADSHLATGRGGWVEVRPDLTIEGHPRVYAIGDVAATIDDAGDHLPQLGSVALQAGRWAARNIRHDVAGEALEPFHYHDKGIMAMIGSGSAVAAIGRKHHELHGHVAFMAWLGVHSYLMSGVRQRVDAFVSWAWDFLGANRDDAIIDPTVAAIDWGDDEDEDEDEDDGAPA